MGTAPVAQVVEIVRMGSKQKTASIVIVTYNNWDDTKLCLDSIFAKTGDLEFEVIVVDNASHDGTKEHLQAYADNHPNLRLIFNSHNAGFARANNQGASVAQGQYLVFLNNDTVVTPGWLQGLIHHLQDAQVGMVGPVTNSASNESRILVDYDQDSLDGLDSFAERYTAEHAGIAFDIQVLAFFCVAMRYAVFEEIGPLDERFGIGMFEDDDYAMRLRQRDYRILCVEDVYIHHSGGKSFLQLDFADYWRLFRENRAKFEEKWQVKWQPHLPRPELLPQQFLDTVEHTFSLQNALLDNIKLAQERWQLLLERDQMIRDRDQMIRDRDQTIRLLRAQSYELHRIYASRTWKAVQKLRQSREMLVPVGSRRESAFFKSLSGLRHIYRLLHPAPALERQLPAGDSSELSSPSAGVPATLSSDSKVPILAPQFFDFSGKHLYLGGAERYLLEIAKLLHSLGYQPVVYQSAQDERWEREYQGIPIIGLPSQGNLHELNRLFHQEISPDVLVIYLAFYLAAPQANERSIGISHGVYWDVGNEQPIFAQHERIEAILGPMFNLARIVSVDTNTINWVRGTQAYLAHKFVYIPNFVDTNQFSAGRTPHNTDRLTVLYPRRLYEPRGFWLVHEILPELLEQYPELEFHFVGQAEPEAETVIQELVLAHPDHVRWYTLPFEEMHRAYQTADITVIPTVHSEGTSLSCLEAMAAGNAVIASNVGGLPDLIISGYNGMLIDPTADALRDALNLLIRNRDLRQKIGGRAVDVANAFDIVQWRTKWTRILKGFLIT